MKTRTVKPCGTLHSSGSWWYLLHPYPVAKDSWQDDKTHRFVCVPVYTERPITNDDPSNHVYPHARHVVTNSFAVEYRANMKEIKIQVLEEVDVTDTELHDVSNEELANILQENIMKGDDYGI